MASWAVDMVLDKSESTPRLACMDTEYIPFPDLPWATEDVIRENWNLLVGLTSQFHVTNLRYASSNRVVVTYADDDPEADPIEFAVVASRAIRHQLRIYTDKVLANPGVSQDLLHARALA